MRSLSVVIPAFNEEGAIWSVVAELRQVLDDSDISPEIIVVDDGSQDGTASAAAAAGALVIRHRSNRGYGAALKTGINAATHNTVAILDADGTYPVIRLPELIEELEHADMVVGARIGADVHIPLVRRPAKWVLRHMANYVSSSRIPDLNSGMRVFRRDIVLQYLGILPNQFSFTTTITLAMQCDNYAICYLPIDYHKRQGRSKIVPWDAASFAILILRAAMLFRPLRVFAPLSFMFGCLGLGTLGFDWATGANVSAAAVMFLVTGLELILIGMLGDAVATRFGRSPIPQAVVKESNITASWEHQEAA
jgi:glycosyltransferase involved in cell wall biosynthesis